jgi:hypothetical protein
MTSEEKKIARALTQKKYRESEKGKKVAQLWWKNFRSTEEGKAKSYVSVKNSRQKHLDRTNARNAVQRAIKNGLLIKQPCLICGEDSESHHPDYSRPLDVIWLCRMHHRETHKLTQGELV